MNKIGDTIQAGNLPLRATDIINVVPAIMTLEPHFTRSEQYAYIPTKDVLNALWIEGFGVFSAQQQAGQHPQHAKHLVRLRHRDDFGARGEGVNELILINSHDGSCSYSLMAGYFRFVCSNGMVVGDTVSSHRVTHRGEIGDIIDVACKVVEDAELVNQSRESMQATLLTTQEQKVFARAALDLRFDESPIGIGQALLDRRYEDKGDDVWSTFNRLQENLTKGGLHGRSRNGRRQTTRPIKSIDGLVGLNKGLWTLAQGMVQLKGGITV